jgi:serralysin
MTLQANYRDFPLSIEDGGVGVVQGWADEFDFGEALLHQEKGGDHAPGGAVSASVDVVPATTFTNVSLITGGYYQGVIDATGDHDWIRIVLIEGETYTFSTMFSTDIGDTVLALRNSAGTLLVENDDANSANGLYNSEITFTATTSGTYFLDVSGFSSNTGTYYLSASAAPVLDAVKGTAATTASVAIGASVNGTIDQTGDHDWFAVQLTAGQTYLFTTSAVGANDVDTSLFLRNASGGLLAYNDDSNGTYSRIRFTAPTTGTYYIDVSGWAESDAGAYRLNAAVAPPLQLYTYDQIAFQLTNTYWGGSAQRFNVQSGGALTVNVTQLTADGQFLAREALKLWSDVTGITFNEVASGGQIQFDDDQSGAFATSTTSGGFIIESQVNISTEWLTTSGTGLRSYSFQTYLHEIGHALGLGHAGPYNSTANFTQDAAYLNDAWTTTVMSYFDQDENTYFDGLNFTRAFAQTPMIADIVAISALYGQANNLRTGDTTYGVNNNSGRDIYTFALGSSLVAVTIADHGGNDTLDYSVSSANQRIDLSPEAFSNIGGGTGNVSIARGTIIENARGGNGGDTLIGNGVANWLTGGLGNDSLDGGSSVDTAVVSGNRSAYTVTQGAIGVFTVSGPDGTDVLTNIEYVQFADQLLRLIPGTGVSVNFNADPDTYMGAIRDFSGNNLGGANDWVRIGQADVDGDGDIDQFFVNAAIGRFAEVATGPDGLVYFSDHGWAGETRVVGIYIDPLVQANPSLAGGPFDSQTRFQNDLFISNISTVLGAADYDRDGLQEVYFRLTDGTAYLHAYMHADGNIRYANYQNQAQVIEFLTQNGWSSSTWAGWFPSTAEPAAPPKAAPVMEVLSAFDPLDPVDPLSYPDHGLERWMSDLTAMPVYG